MSMILLIDNGSSKADATLQLRLLAKNLSNKTGRLIHPVSLQHANKIPTEQLHDSPARVFPEFMAEKLAEGEREFILLPLFFGVSKALSSFIPEQSDLLKHKFGEFSLRVAKVIYPLPEGEQLLSEIINDHITLTAKQHKLPLKNIVLVDHGSPIPRVTEVRKHLANTVQQKLSDNIMLEQAVMERREGNEYDFNGDLLKDWLIKKAESGESNAIIALMFFLAGRHAGEGGDIVEICEDVNKQYPDFKIAISPLISEHESLLSILHSRLENIENISEHKHEYNQP